MLSKNPKLTAERLLIFGAIGIYLLKYVNLKKQGQLAGEPDLAIKIDKQKMFDMAAKHFNINPAQRQVMEGIYDSLMEEKAEEAE